MEEILERQLILKLIFCNIFYNRESSRGLQEKLLWAACTVPRR